MSPDKPKAAMLRSRKTRVTTHSWREREKETPAQGERVRTLVGLRVDKHDARDVSQAFCRMGYVRREAKGQATLFPVSLDELIASEHVCRVIEASVAQLDLVALGFSKAQPSVTGRPAYDPADPLKLHLCGCLHQVRCSRRLEAERRRAAPQGSSATRTRTGSRSCWISCPPERTSAPAARSSSTLEWSIELREPHDRVMHALVDPQVLGLLQDLLVIRVIQ